MMQNIKNAVQPGIITYVSQKPFTRKKDLTDHTWWLAQAT